MNAAGLTQRQADVLRYIESEIAAGKPSPTLAEISTQLGFASKSSAYRVVHELESRGRINLLHHCSRSITLVEIHCPHCGGRLGEPAVEGRTDHGQAGREVNSRLSAGSPNGRSTQIKAQPRQ